MRKKMKETTQKEPKPIEASFWILEDDRIAEMTYDETREPKEAFVLHHPKDNFSIDQTYFEDRGKTIYPLRNDDLIAKKNVLLPSTFQDYGHEIELFEAVRKFIHKYLGVTQSHERLASLYVPFTWIYDCFTLLPYLLA